MNVEEILQSFVVIQAASNNTLEIVDKVESVPQITAVQDTTLTFEGWGYPTYLFDEPLGLKEVSVTFDQLGRPIVFYRINDDDLYLYSYDANLQRPDKKFVAKGKNPIAGFDLITNPSDPTSDALIFYKRDGKFYMRVQREEFKIEREVPITVDAGADYTTNDLRLYDAGLRLDNRFQLGYIQPAEPPPPPPAPPRPRPLGIYDYRSEYSAFILSDKVESPDDIRRFSCGFKVRGVQQKRKGDRVPLIYNMFGYIYRDVVTESGYAEVKFLSGISGYLEYMPDKVSPKRWILNVWGILYPVDYSIVDSIVEVENWYFEGYMYNTLKINGIYIKPLKEKEKFGDGARIPKSLPKTVRADSRIVIGADITPYARTGLYDPITEKTHRITSSNWLLSDVWYKMGTKSKVEVPFNLMYEFSHYATDPTITGQVLGHDINQWKRSIKDTEKYL